MNWGAVIAAAITGVVGIAGIGGALLSARMTAKSSAENLRTSISAEDARARNAEKRRTYANCLAVLTLAVSTRASANPDDRDSRTNAANLIITAANAVFEVKLIAPPEVDTLAIAAMQNLSSSKVGQVHKESAGAITRLASAMRADLDEPG